MTTELDWELIWEPVPLAPVPVLATLREMVLERSEKRMPKWGFRLDSDLVLQLQPRPVSLLSQRALDRGLEQQLLRFEGGLLFMPDGAPANAFHSPLQELSPPWLKLNGIIGAVVPEAWTLKINGYRFSRKAGFGVPEALAARSRLVEALHPSRWADLTARRFLSPKCLICGKALTDPASMARFIGPECAGTASLHNYTYQLQALTEDVVATAAGDRTAQSNQQTRRGETQLKLFAG